MRKPIAAAAIISTAGLMTACSRDHGEGGGPTVSRNYQVGGFSQIEVAGPYDVEVRTGSGRGRPRAQKSCSSGPSSRSTATSS